ncbi:tRNA uracil 4-sulfurtransferase ThiI [Spongorhabdus nitratireducens]
MKFVVKLFPEISIKSTPVRKRFVKQLRGNIRKLLSNVDENVAVTGAWDQIDIETSVNDERSLKEIGNILSCIPGIHEWREVLEFPVVDLDDMAEKALASHKDELAGKTFRVTCKRQGNHEFKSIDVERHVGGYLNWNSEATGVKLKNPDVVVQMEVRRDRFYVVQKKQSGLGGFPLGSQEPVLSLISGGFDSSVSSFLTMRRGIRTHFVFFNLGGHAHELAVKEIAFYLWNKYGASHNVKFITVPFEGVVAEILDKVENSQMGVILKRMMLRASTQVAKTMDIQALVTGEAVAQVSSQTLTNLAVIDSVTDTLVIRPLATMDKQDIIDYAEKIGTEEFSRNIPEYCAVISKKPTTKASQVKIAAEESKFDFSLLDKAVEERREVSISNIVADDLKREEVEVISDMADERFEKNAIILDVRHPTEEELKPLSVASHEVVKVPFYQLNSVFPTLDKERHYLLYCEKGVMSQLHAMHLREDGHTNVDVYSPNKKKKPVVAQSDSPNAKNSQGEHG